MQNNPQSCPSHVGESGILIDGSLGPLMSPQRKQHLSRFCRVHSWAAQQTDIFSNRPHNYRLKNTGGLNNYLTLCVRGGLKIYWVILVAFCRVCQDLLFVAPRYAKAFRFPFRCSQFLFLSTPIFHDKFSLQFYFVSCSHWYSCIIHDWKSHSHRHWFMYVDCLCCTAYFVL